MSFNPDVSNVRLKAPDKNTNYAKAALEGLQKDGVVAKVLGNGKSIPHATGFGRLKRHLQGVAIRDSIATVTTSTVDGLILTSKNDSPASDFSYQGKKLVPDFNHPGGIQTIGSYAVVPVYNDQTTEVQFYEDTQELKKAEHLTIRLNKRVYSVGISDAADEKGDFYLLALGVDSKGKVFDFYRSQPNLALNHQDCRFKFLKNSKFKKEGYPNSISLLADEANNLYFLGLHTTGRLASLGLGKDWADLYQINLQESGQKMFKKIANFHAICHKGPAFRWGGSARVTSDSTISIFVCERNVQKSGSEIRLNVFRSDNDPEFGNLT
ncbi:hypothetical protein IH879_22105 [candidate division KSB1 bacterium]|nr:hypothetical protein [candidate division KSB1 bacterium]